MKAGIFYGSNSGNTARAAEMLAELLELENALYDVADEPAESFFDKEFLILGTCTWNIGELQEDWQRFGSQLVPGSLKGRRCVLFGLGDQGSYPDSFADGLASLAGLVLEAGAEVLVPWETKGYHYAHSRAEKNGYFCGLVLDEDCQAGESATRMAEWARRIKAEMKKRDG